MNLFELVLKQMRQRALSTWLTLLSVLLGVGLAVAIMVFQREGDKLFGQSEFGYDVLIGPKGSKLQLVLNTVYQVSTSPGNIPYAMYENLPRQFRGAVQWAVPFAVGDTYEDFRIVGTSDAILPVTYDGQPIAKPFEFKPGQPFELAQGRAFHPRKFEAVIGSDVAARGTLQLGSAFKPIHGAAIEGQTPDVHEEQWEVVGVLKETKTAMDRVIFIPLVSFYAIPEHESALEAMSALVPGAAPTGAAPKPAAPSSESDDHAHDDHDEHDEHDHDHAHAHAYELNNDGTISLRLDKSKWKLSAIAARSRGGHASLSILWAINNANDAMAVNPAMEMRNFFDTFLKGSSQMLLVISLLVTVVAAVSILVSIYNSVAARLREIAILRALGATRNRVLLLICLEAGLIGLAGGILGLLIGHALAAAGSVYLQSLIGQGINWIAIGRWEWLYLGIVVLLSALAGLVPAMKAYRTNVATNLVAAV